MRECQALPKGGAHVAGLGGSVKWEGFLFLNFVYFIFFLCGRFENGNTWYFVIREVKLKL